MTGARVITGDVQPRAFWGGARWIGGLLVWWMMLGLPSITSAEAPRFIIDVWSQEAGLPDSTVTAVTQTPDGFLWVGTYNGLARFDGVEFDVYDPLNTPELTHPRIWELFVDPHGVLWINTADGSLTSYQHGQFRLEHRGAGSDVRFSIVSASPQELMFGSQNGDLLRRDSGRADWTIFRPEPSPRPSRYIMDASGQVWWYKSSQGLFGLLQGDQLGSVPLPEGLSGSIANTLDADPVGGVWVGTDRGLALAGVGGAEQYTPTNGEPVLDVEYVLALGGGTNWVWGNGRLRRQEGRRWVAEVDEWAGLLGTSAGREMGGHIDRQGGVWFNHYGNGLFYISPEGEPRRLTDSDRLPGNRVGAWFEDREGNIWVGVDRGGLVRVQPALFHVVGEAQGLPASPVTSVLEAASGEIWIGTFGGGVVTWEDAGVQPVLPEPLTRNFVFSLCEVQPGVIWLSAIDEDLYQLDDTGYRRAPWSVHGVKVLTKDAEGRIWAGWKDGVGYWDVAAGVARVIDLGDDLSPVRAIGLGLDGSCWFGSDAGYLYRLHEDRLSRFVPQDQLTTRPVRSLWVDADGVVWVGTFGGGLLRFEEEEFTRFTPDDGLPSPVISQVIGDDYGRLWCGTPRGLFHVRKSALDEAVRGQSRRLECVVYTRSDGLPSLEFSDGYNPASLRARDSKLWFSTEGGLVSVDPGQLQPSTLLPPVVIQEMQVDGVRQSLLGVGVDRSAEASRVIEVPPGRNQIRFRFTALNLAAPARVRFRHRLLGHEDGWVEDGTQHEAIYSALRPGRYEFQVTARNIEGNWNDQTAVVHFHLQPRFHQEWWFRAGIGLAALLMGVAAVRRWATRNLRKELAMAEQRHAIELDRARIARDIHDDLGAGLTEITLLSELAQRDPDQNASNYLGQISTAARNLVRAMDETVWAVDPANDTLEGLMTYASKLAQDYLGAAGIRCRLDVPTHAPELPLEAEVRHNLFLAIKESLTNVVKHSQATETVLRVQAQGNRVIISIVDNGHGMASSSSSPAGGEGSGRLDSGHGLSNLAQRMEAIGGHCVVTSEPGQGTRVDLVLNDRGAPSKKL